MNKNHFYLAGILLLTVLISSCKKDEAGNGTKAVFSYVADGYQVNFTNFSSGATSYYWEFGDGSGQTSTSRSQQHIFKRKGDFCCP